MTTRWEYCQVVIPAIVDGGGKVEIPPMLHRWTAESGTASEELADPYRAMAGLGNDGWEMVGQATVWAVVGERAIPAGQAYTFKWAAGV